MKRSLRWLFIKKANIAPVTESISCPVGVEIKGKGRQKSVHHSQGRQGLAKSSLKENVC